MKKIRLGCVLFCIALTILMINALFIYLWGYPRVPEEDLLFPDKGIWICEELGITLDFDQDQVVITEDKNIIRCSIERDRGVDDVYICCNELNNPSYAVGYQFLSGDYLGMDGDTFYIKDHKSKIIYTFRSVSE